MLLFGSGENIAAWGRLNYAQIWENKFYEQDAKVKK